MERKHDYHDGYKGTNGFSQDDIHSVNTTGFRAAVDNYSERGIGLNEQLINNKPATFFLRMNGDAMIGAGIFNGDILIVDRSIKAISNKVIVAIVEGDLVVRRLHQTINRTLLIPENPKLSVINMEGHEGLQVWGVVTYIIHAV